MVLGFKSQFVEPILKGTKIHSIRVDAHNRWKAGRAIQMATGVRTKRYNCFREEICKSIQSFEIQWDRRGMFYEIKIDGRHLKTSKEVEELAHNDGFVDTYTFIQWFNTNFKGRILHWTDKKY